MGISSLWSVWLEGPNGAGNFVMPHDQEIIIDDARNPDLASYQRALNNAFAQYFRVLKPGSYMIVTFHSKEPRIFNALRVACQIAGFEFQNIHFQENLRAGETGSNDPADTANSDFYLRFHKPENVATTTNPDEDTFKRILKKSASETLLERGDPTTLGELLPKL